MEVTMLLSRLDQTGMTTHTLDLAGALVRKGVKVTVITGWNENKDDVADALKMRLVGTGASVKTFYAPNRKSGIRSIFSAICLLNIIVRSGGVLHVQSPYLSWAPWLLGRKFISTLHVADLVKCLYYKNATHLIAISNETKEYAQRVFGYKDDDITIINHGVSEEFAAVDDHDTIVKNRKRLKLPVDKLILTIVGSIEPRKGHDILLKAVAQLKSESRSKIHIVFLGSDKTESRDNTRWLERTIAETHTADIVSHFEYQDSKLFYRISDIFLLPSWLEGFPLVVVEAMLSGCLCIRTDAEGAFEQIINGETGYVFPKGDVNALTHILENVINDDELRSRISMAGRQYALTHFVSDVMAANTIEVYKKLQNNNE